MKNFNFKKWEKIILQTHQNYKSHVKKDKIFSEHKLDATKLLLDASVTGKPFKAIMDYEKTRQIDKSNNNLIGKLSEQMLDCLEICKSQIDGFDLNCQISGKSVFVEIKNKYNTMNHSSSNDLMLKMQSKIDDKNLNECYLVEVIASKSQNIKWIKKPHPANEKIRRISIDQFLSLATDDTLAFKKVMDFYFDTIAKVSNFDENDKKDFQNLFSKTFKGYIGYDSKD